MEWLPFELDPGIPPEGQKLSLYLKTPLPYLFHVLNTAARDYGLYFLGTDARYNTHRALLAAEYARDQGREADFVAAVFRAYFSQGRNVSDPAVLADIARVAGLDPVRLLSEATEEAYGKRLRAAREKAERLGVRGTPTFLIDGAELITGAQPLKVFRQRLALGR